jgi:PKD repeat protein
MYSTDQKNIVIGNLASVAFLENLVDESHNASTGVGSEPVLCVAQFESDEPTICNGQSIQYYDNSYANIESRIWTFEGGTPASSTEENPIVTYETPGNYAVTLEVTDGVTSISTTKTDYVLVLSNPGTLLPYAENFETLIEIPDNNKFLIQNQDGGEPWKLTNSVGYSGTNSAFLKNYGVSNGSIDELISGTFDLSEIDSEEDIIFNFKYAYHKKSEDDDEWLRFSISKDCGQTWAVRKNIHGDALSEERSSTSYMPANKEEWTQVNITNINSDYYTADFRFKFSFENDGGNNIYIDDINFYPASMASVIEDKTNELINNLSLFPNPVSNTFQLTYSTDINEDINIDIYDLVGKKIETIFIGSTQVGVNNIQYSTERLTPGVYQIILSNNSGKQNVIKLIKE